MESGDRVQDDDALHLSTSDTSLAQLAMPASMNVIMKKVTYRTA